MMNFYLALFSVLSLFTGIGIFAEYGTLAKKKCQEYAKAVYAPQYGPDNAEHLVSECGLVSVPLIVGGEEAKEKEFPHMAVIGYGENANMETNWLCGGSLISEQYVLTAAHCLQSKEYGPAQKVKLGIITLNKSSDIETVQEYPIATGIAHPSYSKPSKYHDIALLRLEAGVHFTAYVRPACLNTDHNFDAKKATATGFGKTKFYEKEGSKFLMKVDLDIIPASVCSKYFPPRRGMEKGLINETICAGVFEGGKDTCQGDSGGPLQVVLEEPYCMHSLIGITSLGIFCGYEDAPAIYTNIVHYVAWIENIVWGENIKE